MKNALILILIALSGFTFPASLAATETDNTSSRSLWIGSHYTTLADYTRKVGEYDLGKDKLFPELRFDLHSQKGNNIFDLQSHYYDYRNIFGRLNATAGDRFVGQFQYRTLTKEFGQDLLSNLETREWLSTRPGGKILTHDLSDSGADYNIRRQEVLSRINVLISRKNNIHLMAAHRAILEKGDVQQINTNHCSSCHVVSQTRPVDKRTQQFEAGLQADISKLTAGYTFNYRTFASHATAPMFTYDSASHPVSGASGPEFKSRLIFSDTTLAVGTLPTIHKAAHKARLKGEVAGGQMSSSFTYSSAKNMSTELSSDAYGASMQYARRLSPRTRLVAKASVLMQKTDDVFVDLPTWRAGRPGTAIDFDFTRYSSLNRLDAKGSVEMTSRLSPKSLLSLLAAYNRVRRDDYPYAGADYTTNKYTGQAKLRYRPTTKLDATMSYRFEKTDKPFISGRGLFEHSGRDILQPLDTIAATRGFIYYFQREALRYQSITTLPTDRHEANLGGSLVMSPKVSLQWTVKGVYDKNGDLDSLDVKHVSFQPTIGLTLTPNQKRSYAVGYSYTYDKSRLPVTMPLFDG